MRLCLTPHFHLNEWPNLQRSARGRWPDLRLAKGSDRSLRRRLNTIPHSVLRRSPRLCYSASTQLYGTQGQRKYLTSRERDAFLEAARAFSPELGLPLGRMVASLSATSSFLYVRWSQGIDATLHREGEVDAEEAEEREGAARLHGSRAGPGVGSLGASG